MSTITKALAFRVSCFLALLVVLLMTSPAMACLWDRDTPRDEATKNPEVYKAIIGWFDRNPDLYYQMRLERVSKEIEKTPGNLELYDDAGVACDRLGKSDEAIGWMEKKKVALEKATGEEAKEHEYRYLANLGTFYVHRWVKTGADREKMEDLKQGRELIEKAIKLNPDAHFGREKVQLKVIEWLIDPSLKGEDQFINDGISRVGYTDPMGEVNSFASQDGTPDVGKGLAGLVVLGNAWGSFDIYMSIAGRMAHSGNGWLEVMALARARELAEKGTGRISFHPKVHGKEDALAILPHTQLKTMAFSLLRDSQIDEIRGHYKEARARADERHELRTGYMLERLKAGKHPDTDTGFWGKWVEPTEPKPAGWNPVSAAKNNLGLIVPVVIVVGLGSAWLYALRRRRKQMEMESQASAK